YVKRGKVVRDGTGLSFWYRPLSAVLSEIPVDDRELPLLFHGRTADFQAITVQLTRAVRLTDLVPAAARIDFSIDPDDGVWRGDPLTQVSGLLTESTQQHALEVLSHTPLASALVDGVAAVRERGSSGLG